MAVDFDFLRHRLGLTGGGGASLALLRQRFDRAEAELKAARAAMRSAADAAGVERAGLFADSVFIKRSTGDRWHEAGLTEGRRELTDTLLEAHGRDPAEVRAGIKARLKVQRAAMKAEDELWAASGFDQAVAAKNYAKAVAIFRKLHPENDPRKVTAAKVLAAGARARMSGSDERPLPPKDSLAAQVIRAGQRRRGEIE